jgi:hypothetical protein
MLEDLLKFPCSFQKRPLTQWNKNARRDADVRNWQLIGVPTGVVNGFDVLDVDVAGLGWLDSVWDRLPPTRAHATRSGGRHLFFKHADGLRNSVSRIADGVDVRADGGFVIWWPRQGLRVLSDAEIAEWPAWLLALAQAPVPMAAWQSGDGVDGGMGERTHAAISTSTRVSVEPTLNLRARCKVIQCKVERAQVGERNRLLHWAACRFGEMIFEGVIKPDVAVLLLESSAKICGLWRDDGAAQCRATIKSGIAAGIRDANYLWRGNVIPFKQIGEREAARRKRR